MVTYHAAFIPVPSQVEKSLYTALHTFVAANKPAMDTRIRAGMDGGITLVDLRAQIMALRATVGARAAGVGGLLRLLALQEHIVASSTGTLQASSSSAAHLVAWHIPTTLDV